MSVTGEQVKAAALAAGISKIDHHECGGCGFMVYYSVSPEGDLFFHPACNCGRGWSPIEPRTWDSAAAWINMQERKGTWGDVGAKIAAKFGLQLEAP